MLGEKTKMNKSRTKIFREKIMKKRKFNQETLDAIQETRDIISGKIQAKRYASVEEMFSDNEEVF